MLLSYLAAQPLYSEALPLPVVRGGPSLQRCACTGKPPTRAAMPQVDPLAVLAWVRPSSWCMREPHQAAHLRTAPSAGGPTRRVDLPKHVLRPSHTARFYVSQPVWRPIGHGGLCWPCPPSIQCAQLQRAHLPCLGHHSCTNCLPLAGSGCGGHQRSFLSDP
jgi:hypothetical protein